MKRTLLFLCLALPWGAAACYNDRDTLGFELRNRPDVQRALTGRFERNPPLYYEMRVARLRAKPSLSAAETDDLAVALGRLGCDDEALAALARKRCLTKDDGYRLYANRGTIRAHRWLKRRGAIADLKEAEADIAKALELNPEAHFGREGTQLEVLRWLEDAQNPKAEKKGLGEWLNERMADADPMEGLAGLVTLGAAWESSDVALALAELATIHMDLDVARFAELRYRELTVDGRKPFSPARVKAVEAWMEDLSGGENPVKETDERFRTLRWEADDWQRARTERLTAGLRAGRHPDTDPGFWKGWDEPAMPRLPVKRGPMTTYRWIEERMDALLVGGAVVVSISALGLALLVRRLRRKGA